MTWQSTSPATPLFITLSQLYSIYGVFLRTLKGLVYPHICPDFTHLPKYHWQQVNWPFNVKFHIQFLLRKKCLATVFALVAVVELISHDFHQQTEFAQVYFRHSNPTDSTFFFNWFSGCKFNKNISTTVNIKAVMCTRADLADYMWWICNT